MLPTLREGQLCIFLSAKSASDGDVVLARTPILEIVKRVVENDNTVLLLGDNAQESTSYVVNERTSIVGKLIWPVGHKFWKIKDIIVKYI